MESVYDTDADLECIIAVYNDAAGEIKSYVRIDGTCILWKIYEWRKHRHVSQIGNTTLRHPIVSLKVRLNFFAEVSITGHIVGYKTLCIEVTFH